MQYNMAGGPLLPDEEDEPIVQSQLIAPDPYEPIYSEKDMRNPRRMMWAGLMSDLGNMFGSWTGSTFGNPTMPGTGFKMQQQAMNANDKMRAANARAKQQQQQAHNQYAQQVYQQMHGNRQFDAQEQQRELAQQNKDRAFEAQQEQWDRQYGLDMAKLQQATQSAAQGNAIKQAEAEIGMNQDFTKAVEGNVAVVNSAQQSLALLSNAQSVSDLAGITSFVKTLDPGSIVSSNEQSSAIARGLIGQIEDAVARAKGEGRISPSGRKEIATALNSLVELSESGYNETRQQWAERIHGAGGGVLNVDRILGTEGGYDRFREAYSQFGAPAPEAATPPVDQAAIDALPPEEEWLKKRYQPRTRNR